MIRHLGFSLSWILSLVLAIVPLSALADLALGDERYTPILLIPPISAGLIWLGRKRIFAASRFCPSVGIPLLLVGIVLLTSLHFRPLFPPLNGGLSLKAAAIVVIWAALFVLFYGMESLKRAAFAFSFLLIMIPMPLSLMDKVVYALQKGSAEVSYALFKLMGVPVFRNGFLFSLPGIDIEVAKECSGIRSSLSIAITTILAAHAFLRSGWSQLWFALLAVPVVIIKNAMRIVTISWLGVYIDRDFFSGDLHRNGGLPFSIVAFAMLFAILRILQKAEQSPEHS